MLASKRKKNLMAFVINVKSGRFCSFCWKDGDLLKGHVASPRVADLSGSSKVVPLVRPCRICKWRLT